MNRIQLLLAFVTVSLLAACGSDSHPEGTMKEVPAAQTTTPQADPMAEIRSKAIPEDDIFARVQNSLIPLQEAYRSAEGKVPGIGKVTLYVDEHMNFLMKNVVGNDVFEVRLNLKDLQGSGEGMRLVPDMGPGEFPGLRIFTQGNKPLVKTYKNGELIDQSDHFEIFLPTRPDIERITPVMVQTIKIARREI